MGVTVMGPEMGPEIYIREEAPYYFPFNKMFRAPISGPLGSEFANNRFFFAFFSAGPVVWASVGARNGARNTYNIFHQKLQTILDI